MLSALLVATALAFTEADADFAYACASNLVAQCTPRDAGTVGGHLAANLIFDTANKTGADVRRDNFKAMARMANGKVVERSFVNLYAEFRAAENRVQSNNRRIDESNNPYVIFVSHYDTKPGKDCPGANDGASTTGLLIALAAALENRGYDGAASVMLIWLDGEECVSSYGEDDGFWGSKRAAEEFQRRELNVKAVVCLDMLGDRNLAITIPSNGSPRLMQVAKEAAHRSGTDVSIVAETMKDDHIAFLEAGYPAIDLIDFDYGSSVGKRDWWHTPQDTPDKISRESLLKSGRLAAELINILAK